MKDVFSESVGQPPGESALQNEAQSQLQALAKHVRSTRKRRRRTIQMSVLATATA